MDQLMDVLIKKRIQFVIKGDVVFLYLIFCIVFPSDVFLFIYSWAVNTNCAAAKKRISRNTFFMMITDEYAVKVVAFLYMRKVSAFLWLYLLYLRFQK